MVVVVIVVAQHLHVQFRSSSESGVMGLARAD